MELDLTDRDSLYSHTGSTDNWELEPSDSFSSQPAINNALPIDDIDTESHYSNQEPELTDHESLYSDTEPWEPSPLVSPPSPLHLRKGHTYSSSPRTAASPLQIHRAPRIPRSGDTEARKHPTSQQPQISAGHGTGDVVQAGEKAMATPTVDIDILFNDIALDAAEMAGKIDSSPIPPLLTLTRTIHPDSATKPPLFLCNLPD
jgi:hypothetical protein